MYKVKIETFGGSVRTIDLPTKNSVNQFVNEYPKQLAKGTAVKITCDLLGIRGSIVGKANH